MITRHLRVTIAVGRVHLVRKVRKGARRIN